MSEHLNLTHLQKKIEIQQDIIKSQSITICLQQVQLDGFVKEAPMSVDNFMEDGYDVNETHEVNLKKFYKTFLK